MATRYTITGIDADVRAKLDSHSYAIARVMNVEIGVELLSRKTIEGLIRITAAAKRFGKHVDIDKVFSDLKESGFLDIIETR